MSEAEEEDGFDAFNDDTFGDGASAWEEDSHEFLVAKATVEEDKSPKPTLPLSDPLQQGLQQAPQIMQGPFPNQMEDYMSFLSEEMSTRLKMEAPPIHGVPPMRPPPQLPLQMPPPHGGSPFDLLASVNAGGLPPFNQRHPPPSSSSSTTTNNWSNTEQHRFQHLPPGGRYNPSSSTSNNLNNVSHMNNGSGYFHQRQQNNDYHHPNHYHHQHNNNNYNHHPPNHPPNRRPHHQRHYNNNNHHHHGGRSEASYYNDRNRETFGDELVDAHKQTFRDQIQRYFYHGQQHSNDNNSNPQQNDSYTNNGKPPSSSPSRVLMTPDRVHANRVLNNRHRSEDSTGDPGLDMRRSNAVRVMMTQKENDEYSGLMTSTERQWVLHIQLSQLKCENPFVDDYYYTVYNQKKQMMKQEESKRSSLPQRIKLDPIKTRNINQPSDQCISSPADKSSNNGPQCSSNSSSSSNVEKTTQLKRTEEGPQLLISEYSAAGEDDSYTPVQFNNSLGKLQAASVKAPRMAIEIGGSNNETPDGSSTSNAQKDSRKYKQTLLELEHLFYLVIEVEDAEKKLAALPTNTTFRSIVESERVEALAELRRRLAVESDVRRYILVRKGKTLLKRVLRHLEEQGMNCVISILFALLPTALRRDRDDQLLPELLPQLIDHFDASPKNYILHYLKLLNCGQGTSQAYLPTFRTLLSSSSFGTTLLLLLVERLSTSQDEESSRILGELASALEDTPIIVPPIRGYSSLGEIDTSLDPAEYRTQMKIIFRVE